MKIILFSLLFLCGSTTLAIDHVKPCLSLEPAEVTLKGEIKREESTDTDHENAEIYWVLHLAKQICVNKRNDEFIEKNLAVNKIQLVFEEDGYKKYHQLLDKFVKVSGKLFSAHTAHHH